ncbi:uncharacterized protein LOC120539227 [Polypterus senegalus]|uniref:uncharacterized protein LOC120539227 n=1 Tax=Polypterus senegalus TaxID=55291 RepID=UPI001963ADD4|nr:uncharacterized protein LOC120539227 [Polypterus senegalus]XP_039625038.1 uncharacterized protein LOC120539227 [Polypterus senegalus]XP_039625039.1 uncharacterized protein LOC120539227 [Polypterus senegalus]
MGDQAIVSRQDSGIAQTSPDVLYYHQGGVSLGLTHTAYSVLGMGIQPDHVSNDSMSTLYPVENRKTTSLATVKEVGNVCGRTYSWDQTPSIVGNCTNGSSSPVHSKEDTKSVPAQNGTFEMNGEHNYEQHFVNTLEKGLPLQKLDSFSEAFATRRFISLPSRLNVPTGTSDSEVSVENQNCSTSVPKKTHPRAQQQSEYSSTQHQAPSIQYPYQRTSQFLQASHVLQQQMRPQFHAGLQTMGHYQMQQDQLQYQSSTEQKFQPGTQFEWPHLCSRTPSPTIYGTHVQSHAASVSPQAHLQGMENVPRTVYLQTHGKSGLSFYLQSNATSSGSPFTDETNFNQHHINIRQPEEYKNADQHALHTNCNRPSVQYSEAFSGDQESSFKCEEEPQPCDLHNDCADFCDPCSDPHDSLLPLNIKTSEEQCSQDLCWQEAVGSKSGIVSYVRQNAFSTITEPFVFPTGRPGVEGESSYQSFEFSQEIPELDYKQDLEGPAAPIYNGIPFKSLLRFMKCAGKPETLEEHFPPGMFHYTPPPMLNPLRKGTGLFVNINICEVGMQGFVGTQDYLLTELCQQSATYLSSPQINIGPEYQAFIPDLEDHDHAKHEPECADLVWQPWADLQDNTDTQQQVENLLDLASCSAVPGGGTNQELALHCLFKAHGNVLGALEMLLFGSPYKDETHKMSGYHYTGSDVWTANERKLFNKAYALHKKNFCMIQKTVKTKRVSQCVEFYYLSKKILQQQKKQRAALEREMERTGHGLKQDIPYSPVLSCSQKTDSQPAVEGVPASPSVTGSFPCKQCGKMFYKIKSRNAHMKIHRQQEEWRDRSSDLGNPPITTIPNVEAFLSRQGAPMTLYATHWDNRNFLDQSDLLSDIMTTTTNLPSSFYPTDNNKLGFNKGKCANAYL